jgi:hypothetical protein
VKAASILVASVAVAGCYRYVPAANLAVPTGSRVSVELTSAGTATLRPTLGDFVTKIEGDVTQATPSQLTLALVTVHRRGEIAPSTWHGESIQVGSSDVETVRQRQLSRGKTTAAFIALGAAGAGLVYAIAKATGLVSGDVGSRPPPNP